MTTISLRVAGLSGRRGIRAVTARLRDLPGVLTVQADPDTGVVVVTGNVTADRVYAALDEAGCRIVEKSS